MCRRTRRGERHASPRLPEGLAFVVAFGRVVAASGGLTLVGAAAWSLPHFFFVDVRVAAVRRAQLFRVFIIVFFDVTLTLSAFAGGAFGAGREVAFRVALSCFVAFDVARFAFF